MPFVWTFARSNGLLVEFGPHATLEDAKTSFQWRYGYYPQEPVAQRPYVGPTPVMPEYAPAWMTDWRG